MVALLAGIYGVGLLVGLPSSDAVLGEMQVWFDTYGLLFVLVSSFLEALFFIGFYYPGSAVIFMGVILSRGDVTRASLVVLMVTLGLFAGYIANYFVGKYGFYKVFEKLGMRASLRSAQERLTQSGMRSIFFTYWAPAFASLTATAAGILQLPFKKFALYSLIAVSAWDIFWGVVVYSLGYKALELFGIKFIIGFLVLWIVIDILSGYLSDKKHLGVQSLNK